MLENPELIIIDAWAPKDWAETDRMVQGAVRREPAAVDIWGPELPKDKTIVVYCA